MRQFICTVLAILLTLTGCTSENLMESSPISSDGKENTFSSPESTLSENPNVPSPDESDYYDVLYRRNARIVASFDFDDFSVWFAITPIQESHNENRWDFVNGGNKGIPLTVAVVRSSAGRSILVEEVPVNLDLRLYEAIFDQIPDELPTMHNQHLKNRDSYLFTNFFDTGVFRGNEGLTRQALMVYSNDTLSLLCQSPMDDSGAAGEYLGGILFGGSADSNILRHIILSKDGVIADSSIVTKSDYKSQFYSLEEFTFTPETNTITLDRITASANGITEAPYEVAFEILAGGNVSRVDNILGLSARTLTDMPQSNSVTTSAQYPIIGGSIYRFPFMHPVVKPSSQLRYDSFDLRMHTHKTEQLLHDFSPETVTGYSQSETGFRVNTDAAAYFFDDQFEITNRIPWPAGTTDGIFNNTFTLMAFRGVVNDKQGLYLLNLETNAPPTLLLADIPWDWEAKEPYGESSYPIRFIGDDRLFVGSYVWEETGRFCIVDFSGDTLEEFPFSASGQHSGGYNYSNSAMTIFLPADYNLEPHYYDFESRILSRADWWDKDDLQSWDYYVPDPTNPRVWFVSSTHFDQPEFPRQVEKTQILRLDFEKKTVEPLISISGTNIALLSAGKNDGLVFAYANEMDCGFAVFRPE